MANDISFNIQLGLFLTKMEETVKDSMTSIIEDHINLLRSGTHEDENPVTMDAIKEVVMQNFEIFLDNAVLPKMEEKLNPPVVVESDELEEDVV